MAGIRWNTLVRVVTGITQVMLGLLMIWLSKQCIDVTIRVGSTDDVIHMVIMLVSVVVVGILLRQLYFYMSTLAGTHQSNTWTGRSRSRKREAMRCGTWRGYTTTC